MAWVGFLSQTAEKCPKTVNGRQFTWMLIEKKKKIPVHRLSIRPYLKVHTLPCLPSPTLFQPFQPLGYSQRISACPTSGPLHLLFPLPEVLYCLIVTSPFLVMLQDSAQIATPRRDLLTSPPTSVPFLLFGLAPRRLNWAIPAGMLLPLHSYQSPPSTSNLFFHHCRPDVYNNGSRRCLISIIKLIKEGWERRKEGNEGGRGGGVGGLDSHKRSRLKSHSLFLHILSFGPDPNSENIRAFEIPSRNVPLACHLIRWPHNEISPHWVYI